MQFGECLPGPCGRSTDPPARAFDIGVIAASEKAAGIGTSISLFSDHWFLAKRTDDRNQAVNLRLVQGSSERRHVPFPLLNLRVDFRVRQLLGFGRIQILRPDRFSDDRAPGSIRTVALGAGGIVKLLAL